MRIFIDERNIYIPFTMTGEIVYINVEAERQHQLQGRDELGVTRARIIVLLPLFHQALNGEFHALMLD
jgi:hypothetical protein